MDQALESRHDPDKLKMRPQSFGHMVLLLMAIVVSGYYSSNAVGRADVNTPGDVEASISNPMRNNEKNSIRKRSIFGSLISQFINIALAAQKAARSLNASEEKSEETSDSGNNDFETDEITTGDLKPKNLVISKIAAGIEAGRAITDALSLERYSSFFGKIGKISQHLSPFFGAWGPVFGFLSLFIPVGPSPELQVMLREFARINAKFDHVFAVLDELEKTILHKALKSQYGNYQANISALATLLNDYLTIVASNASNSTKSTWRDEFLQAYESSDKEAPLKLWQGMMEERVLLDHIPTSVAEFTFNNRLETQNILKSILSVILQGVKVKLIHYQIVGDNETYVLQGEIWIDRIQKLTSHLQEEDEKIASRYLHQAKNDTLKKLSIMFGNTNEEFATSLYSLLSTKFDWRNWLVVAYGYIGGSGKHWNKVCNESFMITKHNKNVVVVSSDKNSTALNKGKVSNILKAVETGKSIFHPRWSTFRHYDAKKVYEQIPKEIREGCDYPGLGVIHLDAAISIKTEEKRLVIVDRKSLVVTVRNEDYQFRIYAYR